MGWHLVCWVLNGGVGHGESEMCVAVFVVGVSSWNVYKWDCDILGVMGFGER